MSSTKSTGFADFVSEGRCGTKGCGACGARVCLLAATTVLLCFASYFIAPTNALAYTDKADIIGTSSIEQTAKDTSDAPNLSCEAGILVTQSGKVLWSRGADDKLPMASLTKIMTSMVVIDKGDLDQKIPVSSAAASKDGSTANLAQGDVLTAKDMLFAMMLPSGNDAATAIAEHYGKDDVGFAALMNQKASELGMSSTHFTCPTGLDDEYNYTTASDYIKLVCAAMQNETFREVVAAKSFTYSSTARGYDVKVTNTNTLLSTYEGMLGVKTGFTDVAGYCFAGAAESDGIELYCIVLGCESESARFSDAAKLLNWGFKHYHKIVLLDTETIVGEAVDTDYLDVTIPVRAEKEVSFVGFDYDQDLTLDIVLDDSRGTINEGDELGSIVWKQGENELTSTKLVAAKTIQPPNILEFIQINWTKFCSLFTGDHIDVEQKLNIEATRALL